MQLIISLLLFYPQNSHQTGTATASRSAYLTREHPKCCERFHLVLICIHQQSALRQIRIAPVQENARLAIDELAKLAVIISECI